ncbi:MAG: tRNA lysidine(34) synthetase TilS [Flavobacteriales bacterium]|nr:tRNA lysidine(34) synthetase TilS [Flavobacteriales bacterium]
MFNRFEHFIDSLDLLDDNPTYLIAVSGGVDSVVLAHLFKEKDMQFAIAHCNFQLRGDDSNSDAEFVVDLAEELGVEVHSVIFDTEAYAKKNGISIQMAARDLRYEWFDGLQEENKYAYLVTAHHQDDSVETFLINLVRGTGIAGLHGILPEKQNLIRPLLFATKLEILDYADVNKIVFCEDITNASNKYLRNKIRLDIIPILEELNPSFRKAIAGNIEQIKDLETIVKRQLGVFINEVISCTNNQVNINIALLKSYDPIRFYLFEFLKSYGFNGSDVNTIIEHLDSEPGKIFLTITHQLLKDRDTLIVTQIPADDAAIEYQIQSSDTSIENPVGLEMKREPAKEIEIERNPNIAMLDMDKLSFPLTLRKWEDGDRFVPLGMQTKKKLSDFFIDQKLNLNEKKNIWLLMSGGDIAWIVGQRIDNRYKVSSSSKNVYRIELSSK